jgi:putative salt-induced outer membrane protein YdiY
MQHRGIAVIGSVLVIGSCSFCCAEEAAAAKVDAVSPWATTIAAGANLTRGNSETMLYNGSAVTEYKKDKDVLRLGVEGNYGENTTTNHPGGEKKAEENVSNSDAFANYKRLFSDRDYVYVDGKIAQDDIADLDYRLIIGPGLGHYFVKNDKQSLFLEAGGAHIKQKQGGKEGEAEALPVAEKYELKITATSKIWESAEYLPAFDDFQNYLLNAEAGIEAAINNQFSLRVVAQEKYNSQPAAGKDDNDFALIVSIVYKL